MDRTGNPRKKNKTGEKTSQNNFRSNVKCNVSHCNDCNVVLCNGMYCNATELNRMYGNGDGIVGYGHGGGMAGYVWYGTICVICMDACNIYIYNLSLSL